MAAQHTHLLYNEDSHEVEGEIYEYWTCECGYSEADIHDAAGKFLRTLIITDVKAEFNDNG